MSDLAEVRYDPARIDRAGLAASVERIGYKVRDDRRAPAHRGALIRFGLAAVASMNAMMLSYALYANRFVAMPRSLERAIPWVLAALAAAVVFGAGGGLIVRALRAARARAVTMDSLIALGSLAAFGYSIVAAARGGRDVYFDGACALVTFWLLGRLIEQAAFRRAALAGEAVAQWLPRKARRIEGALAAWVQVEALVVGDRLRVAPGERVPVDARVVAGTGRIDTAVVDGEPRPRAVGPGDAVPGGAACGEAALDLEVVATVDASLLARIADHVARQSGRRGPDGEIADALARLFVPIVMVLAVVTGAAWLAHGLDGADAFERALGVLVVSCPCALGLAAPLARVVAAGALARRGLILRGEGAIDRIALADRIAFDKTGTLTEGRLRLVDARTDGIDRTDAIALLAALEARSDHPVARAAREAAAEGAKDVSIQIDGIEVLDGRGVRGSLAPIGAADGDQGTVALAGRPSWVRSGAAAKPPDSIMSALHEQERIGRTAVLLHRAPSAWAVFAFDDPVRPEAPAAVAALVRAGLAVTILSGDSPSATLAVAAAVGIASEVSETSETTANDAATGTNAIAAPNQSPAALGALMPEDKAAWLEAVEADTGRRAIFVGDGINDAPALAAAVGCAVATSTDFAREAADVLLLRPGVGALPALIAGARRARRIMRQNLAWAALYNAIALPAAIAGWLSPVVAAAAMVSSGVVVTLNSLRLRNLVEPSPEAGQPASTDPDVSVR